MWQLFLSLLYMSINALLTCFCVENEWQSYALKRKTLRVSSPQGEQRSTYFLSLPWRYGLPLSAASVLLHWTLSQSMFLTALATYKPEGFNNELLFLGSSPRPLMLSICTQLLPDVLVELTSYSGGSRFCHRYHKPGALFPHLERRASTRRELQRDYQCGMPWSSWGRKCCY